MEAQNLNDAITKFSQASESFALAIKAGLSLDNLSEEDRRQVAYALNMCTVSVSQIVDYSDKVILEQEYETILNNINIENIPKDEPLLLLLRQLLDTITFFRIQDKEKELVDKEYQQKVKNAIWSAVPNFGLIVAGGNPITMAISLVSQVGIGYMNYRRTKAENQLAYERQQWQLERSAIEQFNGLRRELFSTAWRLADKYKFPDEFRLTEKQIHQYNMILMDPDIYRKYERLEAIKNRFEAYPPFWYFIGNAANLASQDTSLSIENRQKYKTKAIEYYKKYESIAKNNILREDQLASSCALEHIDLLLSESPTQIQDILPLIQYAIKMSGDSPDILEMCAITYLRLNCPDDAIPLLRYLVNEGYNSIINAQLLSGIYVHKYNRDDYELLARRIGNEYLFPFPDNPNSDLYKLESKFGLAQKKILAQHYRLVLKEYIRSYSCKWNKFTFPISDMGDEDTDFFDDTESAAYKRIEYARRVFSTKDGRERFLQRLSQSEYELNLLSTMNLFYQNLFTLPCLSDVELQNEAVEDTRSAISAKRREIHEISKMISEGNDDIILYQKMQSIKFQALINDSIVNIIKNVRNTIQNANSNEITIMEGELVAFCTKQGLASPELILSHREQEKLLFKKDGDLFEAELLGQKAVRAKRNASFLSELTDYAYKQMENIVQPNHDTCVFYRGKSDFNGYFGQQLFMSHPEIKGHTIFVISSSNKKMSDLIFSTSGVIDVYGNKIRYMTPYHEISYNGSAIILYNNVKYDNPDINANLLFQFAKDLSSKLISQSSTQIKVVQSLVDFQFIIGWFNAQPRAFREKTIRVIQLASADTLKSKFGYEFTEVPSNENRFLILYIKNEQTNEILSLQVFQCSQMEPNLEAQLIEDDTILLKWGDKG